MEIEHVVARFRADPSAYIADIKRMAAETFAAAKANRASLKEVSDAMKADIKELMNANIAAAQITAKEIAAATKAAEKLTKQMGTSVTLPSVKPLTDELTKAIAKTDELAAAMKRVQTTSKSIKKQVADEIVPFGDPRWDELDAAEKAKKKAQGQAGRQKAFDNAFFARTKSTFYGSDGSVLNLAEVRQINDQRAAYSSPSLAPKTRAEAEAFIKQLAVQTAAMQGNRPPRPPLPPKAPPLPDPDNPFDPGSVRWARKDIANSKSMWNWVKHETLQKNVGEYLRESTAEGTRFAAMSGAISGGIDRIGGAFGRLYNWVNPLPTLFRLLNPGMLLAGGILVGFAGAAMLFRKSLHLGAEYQDAVTSFGVMARSPEKGQKLVDDIQMLGVATPFRSPELMHAGRTLHGFGVETSNIIPVLRNLGAATSAAGGGADRLQRLALAYGQVTAKGFLKGEELRQFANAGIGLMDFAKAAGMSSEQFMKAMKLNQVGSEVMVRAFNNLAAPGGRFSGVMDQMAMNASGRWSSIMENFDLGLQKMGLKVLKGLDSAGVFDMLEGWTNQFKQFMSKEDFSWLTEGFRTALVGLQNFAGGVWDTFRSIREEMKWAAEANPFNFEDVVAVLSSIPGVLRDGALELELMFKRVMLFFAEIELSVKKFKNDMAPKELLGVNAAAAKVDEIRDEVKGVVKGNPLLALNPLMNPEFLHKQMTRSAAEDIADQFFSRPSTKQATIRTRDNVVTFLPPAVTAKVKVDDAMFKKNEIEQQVEELKSLRGKHTTESMKGFYQALESSKAIRKHGEAVFGAHAAIGGPMGALEALGRTDPRTFLKGVGNATHTDNDPERVKWWAQQVMDNVMGQDGHKQDRTSLHDIAMQEFKNTLKATRTLVAGPGGFFEGIHPALDKGTARSYMLMKFLADEKQVSPNEIKMAGANYGGSAGAADTINFSRGTSQQDQSIESRFQRWFDQSLDEQTKANEQATALYNMLDRRFSETRVVKPGKTP